MKNTNAIAHVRQLCALGLGGAAIMPALLRSIRSLVPCDSAAYFWADERGEWVNLYAERMLPPDLMRYYFERYYGSEEQSFRERMLQCVATRQPVVHVETPAAGSTYFEEILKPLGAHQVLHLRLQDGGRPLGQLSLYRGPRGEDFDATERATLQTVARYLVRAVNPVAESSKPTIADDFRDGNEAALLVCSPSGEMISGSYRAYALLAHASGEPINRATLGGAVERRGRELLCRLAAALGRGPAGLHGTVPSLLIDNVWGRYRLSAYALGETGLGVLIQRQEHLLIRIVDAMRSLTLSAQQREVAVLLAEGLTNGEIAHRMGVALNTSTYHVKQLFRKLDAHDRTHAIARILDGHTQRH